MKRRICRCGQGPLFSLVLVGLLGGALIGCKSFKDSYGKSFKESYQTSFATSCTNAAVAKGAPQAHVKPYCECMAKYMVEHHDSTELIKISANAEAPATKHALAEATQNCEANLPAGSTVEDKR
jgi:hypothetical protein